MVKITSHTIRSAPWGERVASVLAAALAAVEPGRAVARHMQRSADRLVVQGRTYDLSRFKRILVVGAGKAGAPMTQATARILGDSLTNGIVVVKEGYADTDQVAAPEKITILEAGHPLPDERGVAGAQCISDLLSDTTSDDLVICLISGGGSALLVSPVTGVSLPELQMLTSALLACGATINEINALRKHLDQVKGGKLARMAAPARLITLILSDVVADPLDVIASGPTVPDTSTFAEAHQVLERYAILEKVPPTILGHLSSGVRGEIPETPKPGDSLFQSVQNVIIGSNLQAARAALEEAQRIGFQTMLLTTSLQGEARQVGRVLAAIARQIAGTGQPIPRPACLVAGGETTVTLKGDGMGGRNQELALGAVTDLAGLQDVVLVTLATDGGDGSTDAAGAVVTGQTLDRALQAGLHPTDFLAHNDSYHFFEPLGELLKPGPTQTNVNDLTFIFAF